MRTKQPETKTVLDMECLCRKLAAQALSMSVSTLDTVVAASRTGKINVPLKFYQLRKSAPIWFPKPWLKEWIEAVGEAGGVFINKKSA